MIDILKYFTINGSQVIYSSYAGLVFLTSAIFLLLGVSFAKFLDNSFPKFINYKEKQNEEDSFVKKNKLIVLVEIILQIGIIAVFVYILREVIVQLLYVVFGKKNIVGKPDKYAIFIVAPTMFSQQESLINKITYVWN
jgi:hypothetical protein